MGSRLLALLALFGSLGTLACCAIPALLVALGFGASLASLIGAFPQITILSERKGWVFGIAAALLFSAWAVARNAPRCQGSEEQRDACANLRQPVPLIWWGSLIVFLSGVFAAFILPRL